MSESLPALYTPSPPLSAQIPPPDNTPTLQKTPTYSGVCTGWTTSPARSRTSAARSSRTDSSSELSSAERHSRRCGPPLCVVFLSIYLYLSISIYLSTSVSLYLYLHLSFYISIYIYTYVYEGGETLSHMRSSFVRIIYLSIYLAIYLSVSIYIYNHNHIHLSLSLSTYIHHSSAERLSRRCGPPLCVVYLYLYLYLYRYRYRQIDG